MFKEELTIIKSMLEITPAKDSSAVMRRFLRKLIFSLETK
jgi:hypothetical protein